MNRKFYIIPKKIVLYKVKSNNLKKGTNLVMIAKDSNKGSITKLTNTVRTLISDYRATLGEGIEISNTGLKLSIGNNEFLENNFRSGYINLTYSLIKIESPELSEDLYYCLNSSRILDVDTNIIGGKLAGSYCFEFLKDSTVKLHLEKTKDKELNNAKNYGHLISKTLSSDLKLGNIYVRKDGSFYVYLGSVGKNYAISNYYAGRSNIPGLEYSASIDWINNTNKYNANVLVPEFNIFINVTEKDFYNELQNKNLRDIWIDILNGGNWSNALLRFENKITGALVEEDFLYVEEGFNPTEFIKSYCLSSVGNTKVENLTPVQQYHLLFVPDKLESLKGNILDYVRGKRLKSILQIAKKIYGLGEDRFKKWIDKIKKSGKMKDPDSYHSISSNFVIGYSRIFSNKMLTENLETFCKEIEDAVKPEVKPLPVDEKNN